MMADFAEVAVLDVHTDNFQEVWPLLVYAVKSATFVAIDTELSGLGDRKKLNAKIIDDRYKAVSHVAQTRSILSLGLTSFKLKPQADATTCPSLPTTSDTDSSGIAEGSSQAGQGLLFDVQTFNILLLCSDDYTVEPQSLKFLVGHGFDFNKQYAKGLPYHRGNDKTGDQTSCCIRKLFSELVVSQTPVVFHNGLVDMVFLYSNLFCELPPTIDGFLACASEMLSGGIYDTKYLTEFKARMPASYLEYIFRKSQRENAACSTKGRRHARLTFTAFPASCRHVMRLPCGLHNLPPDREVGKTTPCARYAAFGWCSAGLNCSNSHDIDFILDNEDLLTNKKRNKRQRRKRKAQTDTDPAQDTETMDTTTTCHKNHSDATGDHVDSHGVDNVGNRNGEHAMDIELPEPVLKVSDESLVTSEIEPETSATEMVTSEKKSDDNAASEQIATVSVKNPSRTSGHRAGFDSFMTGFTFAYYVATYGQYGRIAEGQKLLDLGMAEFVNKITLMGKDFPLQFVKSSFVKTSKDHRDKMGRLNFSIG